MKEFEKEIVTKQTVTVYEITKEELEKIKEEERFKGRLDIIEYIRFSIKNFYLELNIAGTTEACCNIIDFINEKTNTIKNVYGYSFQDFLKKERYMK